MSRAFYYAIVCQSVLEGRREPSLIVVCYGRLVAKSSGCVCRAIILCHGLSAMGFGRVVPARAVSFLYR